LANSITKTGPMKHSFLFLSLIFVNFVSAQNFYSGALPTDTNVYNQIGQAPLPIGSNIPNVIDLSQDMPPAGNQYYQNSCVAWALAYANYSYINHINNSCNYLTNNSIQTVFFLHRIFTIKLMEAKI